MSSPSAKGNDLYITAYTLSSALGNGNPATLRRLLSGAGGLTEYPLENEQVTWLGRIAEDDSDEPPVDLGPLDCVSNRLLAAAARRDGFQPAVARAVAKYGSNRVGCFVGTITAGLMHIEDCYRLNNPGGDDLGDDTRLDEVLNLFSPAECCQKLFGISGPAVTVSTACSSSAKVFAAAARHIRAGFCDAAVLVGIEAACDTIIYGFRSLGLLSTSPCRPWDRHRDGISVGEAAGFALIESDHAGFDDIGLLGYGESCDAYHMTAPHPNGDGAYAAIETALRRAGLDARDIDYINLHGSGTPANDASEDAAILRMFGDQVVCSSTKGWTGHTQGAAGITEAIICFMAMKNGFAPASLNTEVQDSGLRARVALKNQPFRIRNVLSNSFGFGGNNCALIFGEPR
jgi:3-oxoacyl-[acyl-carrier-protein] synthase-1